MPVEVPVKVLYFPDIGGSGSGSLGGGGGALESAQTIALSFYF